MTVCLAMIVRNESAVIGRCLDSVLGHVDKAVIVDTGSTDDTVQIIEDHPLPTEVHRSEWRDFGYNRSELMRLARGSADWLLLLDADLELGVRGGFDGKAPKDLDAFMLQHEETQAYWIDRLLRGDRHWEFVGRTHEFIAKVDDRTNMFVPHKRERFHNWFIIDHGDGGCKADKFDRDIRLLTMDIIDRPDDPRPVYYLACTYRDMGKLDKARALFWKRWTMGGWDEEAWHALYQCALMEMTLEPHRGVGLMWQAFEKRPWRAEPLNRLHEFAKQYGWGEMAAAVKEAALRGSFGASNDILFVEPWLYGGEDG